MIHNIPFNIVEAAVTNGFKTELIITRKNQLFIIDENNRVGILLGSATKARIDEIIFNLQQIRNVCP